MLLHCSISQLTIISHIKSFLSQKKINAVFSTSVYEAKHACTYTLFSKKVILSLLRVELVQVRDPPLRGVGGGLAQGPDQDVAVAVAADDLIRDFFKKN